MENMEPEQPARSSDQSGPPSSAVPPACACGSRRLWWVLVAALVAVLIVTYTRREHSPFVSGPEAPGIEWGQDYGAALERAKQQNKPVLLAFSASWCGPCQEMKHATYPAPAVVKAAQDFIAVMIDSDKQADLTEKYAVEGIPAYFILAPDGRQVASFVGFHSPDEFIAQLQAARQKLSAGAAAPAK